MKMCNAFAHRGHEVTLYCRAPSSDTNGDPFGHYAVDPCFQIKAISVPEGPRGQLRYALAVRRRIKMEMPDLVYGRHVYSLLLAALRGLPVVFDSHSPSELAGRWIERYLRWLTELFLFRCKTSLRLICVSQGLLDRYERRYPRLHEQVGVLVCPNGADVRELPRSVCADPEVAKGPDVPVIGYVGTFGPGRGIETVLDLARRNPKCTFLIAGCSADQVLSLSNDTQLPSNIDCLGYVKPEDLPDVYASIDVALAPYQKNLEVGRTVGVASYMSPMKVFEYMAHGKAILASDLAVIREVISDGIDGLLVSPADGSAWNRQLRRLGAEKELRSRLGRAAHAKATRLHSWDARAAAVLQGLESAAASSDIRHDPWSGP